MTEPIFSGTAAVEIQGPQVLEFVSLNNDQAEFDIIGISNPKIRVIDHRPAVKRSMKSILKTGKVGELAEYFNKPAHVTLLPEESGQITLMLDKTRAKKPKNMLWVAIGINGEIPVYKKEYHFQVEPLDDKDFAIFYLFKLPSLTKL